MTMLNPLRRNETGAAAIEFALALPVLVLFIWGIFQIGLLFQANAGMHHALGEGARYAALYDRTTSSHVPSDTTIKARMNDKLFGAGGGTFTVSDPVTGAGFKLLTISYTRSMDFLFFTGPTVTLTRSKKVYTVA